MMLFDSLSSYELSICKCASVLGYQFNRDMLIYVFSGNERMIAKTVGKLFELKVFACANRKQDPMQRSRALSDLNVCNCNVEITDACRGLPIYASCTLTRFCKKEYQKAIYALLTETQEIMFHKRSLKYLYQKTNKCKSCKGGPFEKLMTEDMDFNYNIGFRNSIQIYMNRGDFFKKVELNVQNESIGSRKILYDFLLRKQKYFFLFFRSLGLVQKRNSDKKTLRSQLHRL